MNVSVSMMFRRLTKNFELEFHSNFPSLQTSTEHNTTHTLQVYLSIVTKQAKTKLCKSHIKIFVIRLRAASFTNGVKL